MADEDVVSGGVEVRDVLPDGAEHGNGREVAELVDVESAMRAGRENFRELLDCAHDGAMQVTELLAEAVMSHVKNEQLHVA